jgi:L-cysteine S-thiosulfotransferase
MRSWWCWWWWTKRLIWPILVGVASANSAFAEPRRSGYEDMAPSTQALQKDDTQNPAWLWLKDGERAFNKDCTACHGVQKLRGVAATYPRFDAITKKPVNLSERINLCRTREMKAAALKLEGDELLALETYVASLSRGLPITPPKDDRLKPFLDQGKWLYEKQMGQLQFSCAQCHEQNAGRRLAGATIPQAHPTAYPIYRLEWQGLGSLQRRLRNCMTGVRAEPFGFGSDEFTALELHLKQRAASMPIESPGVRP